MSHPLQIVVETGTTGTRDNARAALRGYLRGYLQSGGLTKKDRSHLTSVLKTLPQTCCVYLIVPNASCVVNPEPRLRALQHGTNAYGIAVVNVHELRAIHVRKRFRGQGAARELLAAVQAAHAEFHTISAACFSMAAAILYLSNGFFADERLKSVDPPLPGSTCATTPPPSTSCGARATIRRIRSATCARSPPRSGSAARAAPRSLPTPSRRCARAYETRALVRPDGPWRWRLSVGAKISYPVRAAITDPPPFFFRVEYNKHGIESPIPWVPPQAVESSQVPPVQGLPAQVQEVEESVQGPVRWARGGHAIVLSGTIQTPWGGLQNGGRVQELYGRIIVQSRSPPTA